MAHIRAPMSMDEFLSLGLALSPRFDGRDPRVNEILQLHADRQVLYGEPVMTPLHLLPWLPSGPKCRTLISRNILSTRKTETWL